MAAFQRLMAQNPVGLGLAAAIWVLALMALATAAGFDLRTQVAPVGAALSLVLGLTLYLSKERSERRRKTLEAYEKQFLDKTLREAIHSLRLAVAEGRYAETTAAAPESHLGLTTLLLNYLETCCAGARHGLYDRDLLREFLGPLAQFMVENFLVAPCRGRLPTEVFLPLGTGSSGVAPEEAAAPFPNLRRFFPEMIAAAQARDSDYAPAPSLR